MPFTVSADPQKWQDLYSEKQAYRDSTSRLGSAIIVLVMGVLSSAIFLLLCSTRLFEGVTTISERALRMIQAILLLMPAIVLGFGYVHLFKVAARFLVQFHNLPADISSRKLVWLRVMGLPLTPPPLSMLIRFPTVSVKDGRLDPVDHWAMKIGGPVKLRIEAGNALYLERGSRFSRVVGQGNAFLEWNERIVAAVNLGPKSECFSMTAWTKDGIRVNTKAKGEYFVGRIRKAIDEDILIPFEPAYIRTAVEETIRSGKEADEWITIAVEWTKGILGKLISEKSLDELFLRQNSSHTLLSSTTISDILQRINSQLQKHGMFLASLQITEIILPNQVRSQRLKTWELNHQKQAVVTDGEIKAYQIRLSEQARAEVQRDLILTLASSLQQVDSANFAEPLLLTLSNFIDQNLKDPTVRAGVAKESLEMLEKMQEVLRFPLHLPGSGGNHEGRNQRNP